VILICFEIEPLADLQLGSPRSSPQPYQSSKQRQQLSAMHSSLPNMMLDV
jgi:hypothetical protein